MCAPMPLIILPPPARWPGAGAAHKPILPPIFAMDLNKQFIKTKRPCADGFRWFLKHHQAGADYQPLLDALVRAGRTGDACWLLEQFGPTDAVLELDALDATAIVFAGSLLVRDGIEVDTLLVAGGSIRAGGGIRTGQQLSSGGEIRAGGAIRCGADLSAGGDVGAHWNIAVAGALRVAGNLRAGWDIACGAAADIGGNCIAGQGIAFGADARCGHGLRAGEGIAGEAAIRAGHGIEAAGDIACRDHLEAQWGVRAGGDLRAGGAIRAGESLQARRIEAGDGYGVYAGLAVRQDSWAACAQVRAIERPARLFSGHWDPP